MSQKPEIKDLLQTKILRVKFTKTDGTERDMICTLKSDLLKEHVNKTDRKKKENENVLSVWDVEKDAFRSFRLDSLISYSVVEEGYEL